VVSLSASRSLRQALRSPRLHHVLITDYFNAAVCRRRALGFSGGTATTYSSTSLAKALTVEQFKAVLAHEFGHLSEGHAPFRS
jgi:Zn-dependent protease with chaperone function